MRRLIAHAAKPIATAEAPTDAPREDGDDEVALADQTRQLTRGGAEVAVGEEDVRHWTVRSQAFDGEVRHAALPEPGGRAHELGALLERDVRRRVGRGVVRDDDARVGKGLLERPESVGEPVRLVPGGDDYRGHGGYRAGPSYQEVVSLPDVEAHITGTVWKVECKVGQSVEEGDTLVILESMKMEMPVEAEDEGTVKEIKCEEGQSVSEGDTLVVLE